MKLHPIMVVICQTYGLTLPVVTVSFGAFLGAGGVLRNLQVRGARRG